MRGRVLLLSVVASLVVASCGGGESADTAPFHAIPDDPVVVTGTATCEFTQEGIDPEGGDNNDLVTCRLSLSDPRVSGTETHDRFRYHEADGGWVWVAEDAVITNGEGSWRGIAQAADDGRPIGEAHYTGEGGYEGLEFHYYFSHLDGVEITRVDLGGRVDGVGEDGIGREPM